MKRRLSPLLRRFLDWCIRLLPANALQTSIASCAATYARALPPDAALRFLFGLDAALYPLQGKLAAAYDGSIHTKHRHTRYHDFLVGRVEAGERVLDVGCGIGAVAYDIANKAGAHLVGIDLNAERIAQARQRYPHPNVEYTVGDVLRDLPEDAFDVVVLSNVLEHLPERVEFLRRIQQIAKPARLLIRVPLFERDWRVPLKKELGVEWRLDKTHETEYTLESFAAEIAAAGMAVVHQEVRWGEIWAEVVSNAA